MKKLLVILLMTAFSGVSVFSGPVGAKTYLQVKGSDTEVNLVQRLAEMYMKKDPNASIAVTGGGSGVGIAAIINKTTDLCQRLPSHEGLGSGQGQGQRRQSCREWPLPWTVFR